MSIARLPRYLTLCLAAVPLFLSPVPCTGAVEIRRQGERRLPSSTL